MRFYLPTEDNIKCLGRTDYNDEMLWCAFSGSGAEFTMIGTKAVIHIVGDSAAVTPDNDGNYARIGIYVNGTRVVDDLIRQEEKKYTVFESAQPAEAVISVVKLSEAAMSTFAIRSIAVNAEGMIQPTRPKDTYIEFIGDSITCGYGVDDENFEHSFSTATEDVTRAYAYRTAQKLDADYSLVSLSGYGIISGYTESDEKLTSQLIPTYYDTLGYSVATLNGRTPADTAWDFSRKEPDMIVINLGTNDDSYCGSHIDRQQEYIEQYIEFVKHVRSKNPYAPILCVLGTMGDNLYPCVEKVVAGYREQTGDDKIQCMHLDPQLEEDGLVADYHPTAVTHGKVCERVTERLRLMLAEKATPERPIPHKIKKSKPIIALTFDDGPNTTTTMQVIDKLEKHQVVASFFVVGHNINSESSLAMRRAFDLGCDIQNHSYTHSVMTELEEEVILQEILDTSAKVMKVTGVKPTFFRPPYIAVNQKMFDMIDLPFICGIGADDWEDSVSAAERAERIISTAADGGIILLHDMEGNDKTVEALDTIIPTLLCAGYQFVTISELFAAKGVVPDHERQIVYSNATQKTMYL